MKNDLNKLRSEIDELDKVILKNLSKRMRLVKKIGEVKKLNNIDLLDEKRKSDVLKLWKNTAKLENISENFIEKIYEMIHAHSIKIENKNK